MHAHRSIYIGLLFALTVLLLAGPAWAAGDDGLGVYIGRTDSTVSGEGSAEFDVSGSTFGVDYQFPLGESFSFNPFIMFASEDGGDAFQPIEVDSTIFALQLRYWIGGLYLGAHVGRYETDVNLATDPDQSSSDTGFGAVLGWEGEVGIVLALQYDTFTFVDTNAPGGGAPRTSNSPLSAP